MAGVVRTQSPIERNLTMSTRAPTGISSIMLRVTLAICSRFRNSCFPSLSDRFGRFGSPLLALWHVLRAGIAESAAACAN